MTFTREEIIFSVICSLAYGVLFSVLFCIVKISREIGLVFLHQFATAPDSNSKSDNTEQKPSKFRGEIGAFTILFLSIAFTVGFCLMSYLSLDGEIRLYMLVLSFASFYLSKFAFFDFCERLILLFLDKIFWIISRLIRVVFLPILKALKKIIIFIFKKYIYLLDKRKRK